MLLLKLTFVPVNWITSTFHLLSLVVLAFICKVAHSCSSICLAVLGFDFAFINLLNLVVLLQNCASRKNITSSSLSFSHIQMVDRASYFKCLIPYKADIDTLFPKCNGKLSLIKGTSVSISRDLRQELMRVVIFILRLPNGNRIKQCCNMQWRLTKSSSCHILLITYYNSF